MNVQGNSVHNSQIQSTNVQNTMALVRPLQNSPASSASVAKTESTQNYGLGTTGEIDEEQFQHALVKYVLEELNPEAASMYQAAFQQATTESFATEDAVKAALRAVVNEGVITQVEAEKINGMTFQAAQLDDNLEMLFDGRGGPNDNTVAKAAVADAAASATAILQAAEAGEITLSARSLNAESNLAPGRVSSTSAVGSSHSIGGSNEFLWKPQSESNGKLVVLLPSQYTGQLVSAGIYSDLPANASNRIEEGKFAGDTHNGGRAHFRFSKSGGSYPDGVYMVAKLRNGRTVSFPIGESSARNIK